jgi:hypothetical protein
MLLRFQQADQAACYTSLVAVGLSGSNLHHAGGDFKRRRFEAYAPVCFAVAFLRWSSGRHPSVVLTQLKTGTWAALFPAAPQRSAPIRHRVNGVANAPIKALFRDICDGCQNSSMIKRSTGLIIELLRCLSAYGTLAWFGSNAGVVAVSGGHPALSDKRRHGVIQWSAVKATAGLATPPQRAPNAPARRTLTATKACHEPPPLLISVQPSGADSG